MRRLAPLAFCLLTVPAWAGTVSSEYTKLDAEKDCAVFSAAGDDGGDWADMICSGYRGYPVLLYYGDARESLFYGLPPGGDLAPAWESFSAFNSTGPTIEWRIETDGDVKVPFATIHRWFVSADPENPDKSVEVLAIEKVGQVTDRSGCVVGYVVASGNAGANEAARRIADQRARAFECGADEPTIEQGSVPMPDYVLRYDN